MIQKEGYNDYNRIKERSILIELHNIISRKEHFWKKRSRINWIKEGDQNTRIFHLSTLKHQENNSIQGINKVQAILTNDNEIVDEAVQLFSSLLSSDSFLSKKDQEEILASIPNLLQDHHNSMLKEIPTMHEINQALFSLPFDKAPGSDSFPTFFFQIYWEVVKGDVVKVVQEFFGARNLLKELNATFMVLILKTPRHDFMDKFRLISLCNSFYKIILKVLTTKSLNVLPLIISPQKIGFVLGRQILDSIMMVHEVIHSLEVGKREGFLLKLDLSKVYDRVDQDFLKVVLLNFGFDAQVCKLILQLVSTPSLSIIVNGAPSNFFFPSRGLRQGDPLSPILFIIMAQCIKMLIQRKRQERTLHGIKPSSRQVSFTHQKLLDDTIMGGEAIVQEAKVLKNFLDTYMRGIGQSINWEKSLVFFVNTPNDQERKIAQILGRGVGSLPSSYLVMPLGSKPPESFQNGIIDRFNKKLVGWKGATLTQVGKCIMVKSTLQNLPTYALSLFGILVKYVDRMEKIQRDFLWT